MMTLFLQIKKYFAAGHQETSRLIKAVTFSVPFYEGKARLPRLLPAMPKLKVRGLHPLLSACLENFHKPSQELARQQCLDSCKFPSNRNALLRRIGIAIR